MAPPGGRPELDVKPLLLPPTAGAEAAGDAALAPLLLLPPTAGAADGDATPPTAGCAAASLMLGLIVKVYMDLFFRFILPVMATSKYCGGCGRVVVGGCWWSLAAVDECSWGWVQLVAVVLAERAVAAAVVAAVATGTAEAVPSSTLLAGCSRGRLGTSWLRQQPHLCTSTRLFWCKCNHRPASQYGIRE